jgi:hypothetical protein
LSDPQFRLYSAGQVWTKLFSEGYGGSQWAVDKLIASRGQHTITIPDIPAGDYLLRAEIVGEYLTLDYMPLRIKKADKRLFQLFTKLMLPTHLTLRVALSSTCRKYTSHSL